MASFQVTISHTSLHHSSTHHCLCWTSCRKEPARHDSVKWLDYRMVPNFQGAQFSRILCVFSTVKLALRETWLDTFIVCIFIGSTPFGAVVWLCLQSCVQTMSLLCYFSPVRVDQKLPDPQGALTRDVLSFLISAANVRRWSACRANNKIPWSQRGSRTQSSWMYKGWDSKASSRARNSFNHPLFCIEGKHRSHVLRHDSRTPSTPRETARLSSPHVLSMIRPCVRSLRSWDGT